MELMQVYHEAMAKWILARATSGTCEGSEFVFDLIESAIRKEATEILLTPVQESELVRVDFGRLHCYYRQPKITRAQFAYLAIYLVLIGNVAAQEHAPKDYSADQTKGSIICNLEKYAYLTASRLSSSTSNRSAQPRPQGGKNRRRPSSKADMLAEQRLPQMVRESRQ
jgi:hypothetical protein